MTHIPRIGIGGPVGSGKSMLIERLVPMLAEKGYSVSIISNDVISKEDADRMRANFASQIVNITVDENCYLEYIPDQIIPYKNSRYYQKVNLSVHNNSTLIYSEILTPGRVAMGESFEYDICYLRTHCKNQDKKLRFLENTKIEPKKQRLKDFGILGEYIVVGTVYILTRKEDVIELENTINEDIRNTDVVSVGTSILPDESGIVIRILGNKTDSIFDVIFKILKITRKKILGASFSKIRKN